MRGKNAQRSRNHKGIEVSPPTKDENIGDSLAIIAVNMPGSKNKSRPYSGPGPVFLTTIQLFFKEIKITIKQRQHRTGALTLRQSAILLPP